LAEERPNTSVNDNLWGDNQQLNRSYLCGQARLENKFMNPLLIILHSFTTLHFYFLLNDL
jgi:hypothetical protein